jgi:hypothetical protein
MKDKQQFEEKKIERDQAFRFLLSFSLQLYIKVVFFYIIKRVLFV